MYTAEDLEAGIRQKKRLEAEPTLPIYLKVTYNIGATYFLCENTRIPHRCESRDICTQPYIINLI